MIVEHVQSLNTLIHQPLLAKIVSTIVINANQVSVFVQHALEISACREISV